MSNSVVKGSSHDHDLPFWLQSLHTNMVLSTLQAQKYSLISCLLVKASKAQITWPRPTPAKLPGAQSCLESYQNQRGLKPSGTQLNPELHFWTHFLISPQWELTPGWTQPGSLFGSKCIFAVLYLHRMPHPALLCFSNNFENTDGQDLQL